MSLTPLDAISPIDGRYRKVCEPLAGYFSESALIRYRVQVEAAYLLALAETGLAGPNTLSAEAKNAL
ncbi:MAG: adenylosuccinate lyase, partial [Bacteroidota bacterium]